MFSNRIEEIEEALNTTDGIAERQVLLKQLWRLRRRESQEHDSSHNRIGRRSPEGQRRAKSTPQSAPALTS